LNHLHFHLPCFLNSQWDGGAHKKYSSVLGV
jgi:hypothetical protein